MSVWQGIAKVVALETLVTQGAKIVAIILGALVVSFLAGRALRRLERRAQVVEATRVIDGRRAVTAVGLAGSGIRWVIFFVAAIMVLREAGVDATPILAGAGIVGLAVGFGSQTLVRDVVSGFLIIVEGQLALGDKAEINAVYGVVDEIGLRTTRLVAPGGQVRYFPNGAITSIVRYPAGYVPYLLSIPVAADQAEAAREAVMRILADFDAEHRAFAAPPVVRDIIPLASYGPVMRVEARVLPSEKARFEAKAAARLTALLAEQGLPLPAGREIGLYSQVPAPA